MMGADETLAAGYLGSHPAEAARILERLRPEESAAFLDEVGVELAAAVLAASPTAFAADCLRLLAPARAAEIAERLQPDSLARVLRSLEGDARDAIIDALSRENRNAIAGLLRFPEGTAGAVMDPRVLAMPEDISVDEALQHLEQEAHHLRDYLYVVDRDGKLIGVVGIRDLMLAARDAPLRSAMRPAGARLSCYADIPAILAHPGWEDVHALPVVDRDGALLGVLRYTTFRRLEREVRARGPAVGLVATGVALAEIYWLILIGLLPGLSPGATLQRGAESGDAP